MDFRFNNRKLDYNLIPIAKELITNKATEQFEKDFTKQLNSFYKNSDNEVIDLNRSSDVIINLDAKAKTEEDLLKYKKSFKNQVQEGIFLIKLK